MRAVTVSEYGGQPRVTDIPKPNAGPGQVLIKVLAAGDESDGSVHRDGGLEGSDAGEVPARVGR